MFKIEYSVSFGKEHYESKYPPAGMEDNNIFTIRGKNDSGKTTTLKIVAHAFGALDDTNYSISESIKNEIAILADKDTELSYKILIISPDKSFKIEVSFDGREQRYRINDKQAGKTEVKDQVIVLFDIPEPLQKKLEGAIENVKNELKDYLTSIAKYKDKLDGLYQSVRKREEAESSEQMIKQNVENLRESLKSYEERWKQLDELEKKKRKEFVYYRYNKLSKDFELVDDDIKHIEKVIKDIEKVVNKIPKPPSSKGQSENVLRKLEKIGGEAKALIKDSKELFLSSDIINNKNEYIEIYKKSGNLAYPDNINKKLIEEIRSYFEKINKKASEIYENRLFMMTDKDNKELELIKSLIEILNKYASIDPEIPGTGKRVSDIFLFLTKRKEELEKRLGNKLAPKNIEEKCNQIITAIDKLSEELDKYQTNNTSSVENENKVDRKSLIEEKEELEKKKEELDQKRDAITKELDLLEDEYNSIPNEEKNKIEVSSEIEQQYQNAKNETASIKNKIKDVETELINQKKLLENLSNSKPPSTEYTSSEINSILSKIQRIQNKLKDAEKTLESLDPNTMKLKKEAKNKDPILSKIGEYLADVIQVIYHNHQVYVLKGIDFENEQYIISNGDPIKFAYLGTGHRSLNSLLAKIKQESGEKKKIILIDEIGNMDRDNQQILINELMQEIKDGKTILSLLTERKDETAGVEFEPIREGY